MKYNIQYFDYISVFYEDFADNYDIVFEILKQPKIKFEYNSKENKKMLHHLRTANRSRQKEWDPENKITQLFKAVEVAGELGEALNLVKKISRQELDIKGNGKDDYKEALADELADVVIALDLLADSYGIQLDTAIVRKFNKTSEKHGFEVRLSTQGPIRA